MSEQHEALVRAARNILDLASAPVTFGPKHDRDEFVLVPANLLGFLETALSPEERMPSPHISVDPKMKGGAPCIVGHRLTAEFIADHYWHLGDHLQGEILDAYELTRAEVVVACWYVAEYGTRSQRKRWKEWLKDAWARTGIDQETDRKRGWWSDQFEDVELPPTKRQAAGAAR